MRIAYLCADLGVPIAGNKGASVHLRAVAQALQRRDHEVVVISPRCNGDIPAEFRPEVVKVPFDRTLKSLRQSIKSRADTVLASEAHGLLLNALCHETLLRAESGGRIDGVYERYSLWSISGLRFARSRGVPFLLEVNAPLLEEQHRYRELGLREVAAGIEAVLFREADAIFVPSSALAAYVCTRSGERRGVYVTPNGVDPGQYMGPRAFDASASSPSGDRFTVVFLGSLKPWHGIEILVRGFESLRQRIPNAVLLVVGAGPLAGQISKLRNRLGDEAVDFLGEVPHARVPEILRNADVGVAPYPLLDDFYFSPMKVVEYMAAGLPVVASSIGQLCELVEHERTGLLVPPGDSDALWRALERLAREHHLRRKMGSRARRRAFDRYNWQNVATRIESVLELRSKRGSDEDRVSAGQHAASISRRRLG